MTDEARNEPSYRCQSTETDLRLTTIHIHLHLHLTDNAFTSSQ